jgi:hypothetical protein
MAHQQKALPATEWIAHCAAELQVLAPGLDDEGADEYARLLLGAWPELEPKGAARCFLSPEPRSQALP